MSEVRVKVRVQDWSGSTDKMTTAATVLHYLLFHLFLTDIQEVGLIAKPILQQWKLRLREISNVPEVIQESLHFGCQRHCAELSPGPTHVPSPSLRPQEDEIYGAHCAVQVLTTFPHRWSLILPKKRKNCNLAAGEN